MAVFITILPGTIIIQITRRETGYVPSILVFLYNQRTGT